MNTPAQQVSSPESEDEDQGVTPETALAAAIRLHQARRFDDAEAIYRALLNQFPDMPEALHFLGVLEHQRGRSDRAVEWIEQALAAAPDYADALISLGNIQTKAQQLEQAAETYRRALALEPNHAAARSNLGVALKNLGRFDEAAEEFQRAIELMPGNPELFQNLGNVLKKQCKFKSAAQSYREAIGLRPYRWEDYENLCHVLYLQGEFEEALPTLRQWLTHDPTHPLALHRMASHTGEDPPARASDDYVRLTFDSFSDSFDAVLRGLDYRAPQLVGQAVEKACGRPAADLEVLDAGCGTGLCGEYLRPYARRLQGVDLSEKMLEKAAARGLYDDLAANELTDFIGRHGKDYDLIVAADTLVYFGELAPVFEAVARALRPGGRLVFTVERMDDEAVPGGYTIHRHGRYSHREDYVARALQQAGLSLRATDRAVLRNEGGKPVEGLLVAAQRS